MRKTLKLIPLLFTLLVLINSCNPYSYKNPIYSANQDAENEDFIDAARKLRLVKRKKKPLFLDKHSVGYDLAQSRIYFDQGKYSKAKTSLDKAIATYKDLDQITKTKLENVGINAEDLELYYNDLIATLPAQIVKPYEKSPLSDEEVDDAKDEADDYLKDKKDYDDLANDVINGLRDDGVELPEKTEFKYQRKGKFKEDIVFTLEYGDKDNVAVGFSAFNPGDYITPKTKAVLSIFSTIIENFLKTEKEVDLTNLSVSTKGYADGIPITGTLIYKGEFGSISSVEYDVLLSDGEIKENSLTLNGNDKINNEQLAFLRAYHPQFELLKIPQFQGGKFKISVQEFDTEGSKYRSVSVEITFKDAYKLKLDELSDLAQKFVLVETEELKLEDVVPEPVTPELYKGRKTAIVIGISDYENLRTNANTIDRRPQELFDLSYADNDAKDFVDFLEREQFSGGGWDIIELVNQSATIENINDKIEEVLTLANKEDLIYIFFSGHGEASSLNRQDIYLLPYNYQPRSLSSTGILYTKILDDIFYSPAEHIVLFIDACQSGSIGYSPKGNPNYADDRLFSRIKTFPKTKVVFSSSSTGQLSYEIGQEYKNGLFTYYLIKGLLGECENTTRNSYVELDELYSYVRDNVERVSFQQFKKKQTPDLSNMQTYETLNFPLCIRNKY